RHEAMAAEARRGDGWVKLVGDWIDRAAGADSVLGPLWPEEGLRDGIQAAHEAGARVTVHTIDTRTVRQMLAAGVDCIEHGTGMTQEHMAEAAARAVPVVRTLLQVGTFARIAEKARANYSRYAGQMQTMYSGRSAQGRSLF